MAVEDNDQWVSMVAELLKTFPQTGRINLDKVQLNTSVFTELIQELKKSGKFVLQTVSMNMY